MPGLRKLLEVAEAGLEPARRFTLPRILSPVRLPFRHSAGVLCFHRTTSLTENRSGGQRDSIIRDSGLFLIDLQPVNVGARA